MKCLYDSMCIIINNYLWQPEQKIEQLETWKSINIMKYHKISWTSISLILLSRFFFYVETPPKSKAMKLPTPKIWPDKQAAVVKLDISIFSQKWNIIME